MGVEEGRVVEAERECIVDCREGVRVRAETLRAAEGGAPIEPSIRCMAFVTVDVFGPVVRMLFARVLAGSEVSVNFFSFPAPSLSLSDNAEGGRITEGVLKMDGSRL